MKGIIYKATNTFNGKVYIGQTIAGLPKRRMQHYKDAKSDSDNIFHVALYQYPKESFSWEVIEEFNGSRMNVSHYLNVAEEYHIMKCNSTDERYGYNSTHGGYSSNKFSKQVRERQLRNGGQAVAMLQYDKDGNFVREFSSLNEVSAYLGREKTSKGDLISGLHYGHQWRVKENEYYQKKIKPYIEQKNSVRTVVYDENGCLFGVFDSQKEASKKTGHIPRIRNGVGDISVLEHHVRPFYFFRYDGECPERININVLKKTNPKREKIIQNKSVVAYSLDGRFIKAYSSITEAARETKSSARKISQDCESELPLFLPHNSRKHFCWRYAIEPIAEKIEIIDGRAEKVEKLRWRYFPDGTKRRVIEKVNKKKSEQYKKKMEHRVIQYTLDGEFVKIWDNANQAAEIGEDNQNIIRKSLKGLSSMKSPNYQWRYYTPDYKEKIEPYQHVGTTKAERLKKTTHQEESLFERQDDTIEEVAWDGTVIATYKDTADAAQQSGFSQAYICNVLAGRIKHPKRKFRRI